MLKEDLERWTKLIEPFARSRSARSRVDLGEFARLHHRITAQCRNLASTSDDDGRKLYEELEATVQPWLSPRVLAETDNDLLNQLLERCRRLECALGSRTKPRPVRRFPAPVLALLVAAATVAGAFLSTIDGLWAGLREALQDLSRTIHHACGRLSDMEQLFALAVVLIVISVYNVTRTARG
jgi:hypothetical protein